MPDKLTDVEIKKALKEYIEFADFEYTEYTSIRLDVLKNALDLINRLGGMNEKNENIIRVADKTIETLNAEIRHLDQESDILRADVENLNRICDEVNAENESLKAEVERLKKVEERHMRLYHLLLDPVIVANGKNGELRPIKRTSRQDVYHTLLRAQEIMKIPHRWFPWKRDGDNK